MLIIKVILFLKKSGTIWEIGNKKLSGTYIAVFESFKMP